jgi:hypothetical protein
MCRLSFPPTILILVSLQLASFAESESGESVVYGDQSAEWSGIFNILNNATYHSARTLRRDLRDVEALKRRWLTNQRCAFLSHDDFEADSRMITFTGEREWSPLVGSTLHILRSPQFEALANSINKATASASDVRAKVDTLQLARFQNDIMLGIQALRKFQNNREMQMSSTFNVPERSRELIKAFEGLLEKILLSEEEINRLPGTDDLRAVPHSYGDNKFGRMYFRWSDHPTVHESANLGCTYNDLYILYPKSRADLLAPPMIESYIARQTRPVPGSIYVLLDRLNVLDKSKRVHHTKTTVLVRTQAYRDGAQLADFKLHYLRRGARVSNWWESVELPSPHETSTVFLDIPNVPGPTKPCFEVPLQASCIQCHGTSPIIFQVRPRDSLEANPNDLKFGASPSKPVILKYSLWDH